MLGDILQLHFYLIYVNNDLELTQKYYDEFADTLLNQYLKAQKICTRIIIKEYIKRKIIDISFAQFDIIVQNIY